MSTLFSEEVACPQCEASFPFDLAYSINVERRPDHRVAILEDRMQLGVCPSCKYRFRAAPQLTYVDLPRKQWILVKPADELRDWPGLEQVSLDLFETSYGSKAPALVQTLGKGIRPQVVFGWAALREKLLCQDYGINDVSLELLKLAIMRTSTELPLEDGVELRLIDQTDDELMLGWFVTLTDAIEGTLLAPKDLLTEIDAEAGWEPLRKELQGRPYTDLYRFITAPPEDVA